MQTLAIRHDGFALHDASLPSPRARLSIGAAVTAMHVAAVAAIATSAPVQQALENTTPILVSLIAPVPTPQAAPQPMHKPPASRAHAPLRTESPPTTLVTPSPDTATAVAPSRMEPAPPAGAESTNAFPATPASVAAASTRAPAAPKPAADVPLTPPGFNAAYLNNPAPAYPALSRRQGQEGIATLRVLVDPRGQPSQVELKTSSGHERLDEAAMNAVRHWKFVPARRGSDAIEAWVIVPISFSLRS